MPSSAANDVREPFPAREALIVIAAVVVPLLGLSDRAFNIDEPLFLWLAEQIQGDSGDFFGFEVNWYGTAQPMVAVTRNPPLVGYFIAAAQALAPGGERWLHLVFLFPAVIAALATWDLARRFCSTGWPAALLMVATPVFLVCANTVMSDVPMLALWLVAIACWLRGVERREAAWLYAAAGTIGVAIWTKYFAIALVPLLGAHAIAAGESPRRFLPPLLLPVLVLAGLEVTMVALYGVGAIEQALSEALHLEGIERPSMRRQLSEGLAFAGGCVAPAVVFGPWLWGRRVTLAAIAAVAVFAWLAPGSLAAAGLPLAAGPSDAALGPARWFGLQFAAMGLGGVSLLALAAAELRERRDADRWLLALWLVGSFVFAAFVNWTNNGRSNLVLAPVAAILIVRRLSARGLGPADRGVWLAGGLCAALAFGVAAGDRAWSNGVRDAARELVVRHGGERTLWFHGHWGLQYYLERQGARAVDWRRDTLQPGDRLIVASNNAESHHPPPGSAEGIDLLEWRTPRWVHTQAKQSGASFNASNLGPVPFLLGPAAPDRYRVYRITEPIRFERWFDWSERAAASGPIGSRTGAPAAGRPR